MQVDFIFYLSIFCTKVRKRHIERSGVRIRCIKFYQIISNSIKFYGMFRPFRKYKPDILNYIPHSKIRLSSKNKKNQRLKVRSNSENFMLW